jgi:hypothetical protein
MGERLQAVRDVAQMDYKDVRKLLTDHFRQLLEMQRVKMDDGGRLSFIDRRKRLKTAKRLLRGLLRAMRRYLNGIGMIVWWSVLLQSMGL